LLYVVYLCQKSRNFIDAFICYKQKCKVVSLNLAHLVGYPYRLYRCCVNKIMFKEHLVCQMLSLTLFKIFPSKYFWPFRVTWRHRSRDQSIRHVPFPIGVPLEPSLYLQPFSRYSASKTRVHIDTRRKWFYILPHAMYCIGQTIINTLPGPKHSQTY